MPLFDERRRHSGLRAIACATAKIVNGRPRRSNVRRTRHTPARDPYSYNDSMLMCRFGNDCAPTISDKKVSLPIVLQHIVLRPSSWLRTNCTATFAPPGHRGSGGVAVPHPCRGDSSRFDGRPEIGWSDTWPHSVTKTAPRRGETIAHGAGETIAHGAGEGRAPAGKRYRYADRELLPTSSVRQLRRSTEVEHEHVDTGWTREPADAPSADSAGARQTVLLHTRLGLRRLPFLHGIRRQPPRRSRRTLVGRRRRLHPVFLIAACSSTATPNGCRSPVPRPGAHPPDAGGRILSFLGGQLTAGGGYLLASGVADGAETPCSCTRRTNSRSAGFRARIPLLSLGSGSGDEVDMGLRAECLVQLLPSMSARHGDR